MILAKSKSNANHHIDVSAHCVRHGTFGDFHRTLRKQKCVSIKQLAYGLGVHSSVVTRMELGRKPPPDQARLELIAEILVLSDKEKQDLFQRAAIARAFGTTIDYSFGRLLYLVSARAGTFEPRELRLCKSLADTFASYLMERAKPSDIAGTSGAPP